MALVPENLVFGEEGLFVVSCDLCLAIPESAGPQIGILECALRRWSELRGENLKT